MPQIFVSYRREDTAGHAGRLFDRLQQRFGRDKVFWDVSGSIEPGEPFDAAIDRAVDACDVLLAVIGTRWETSAEAEGARRLDDPDDFVRLEVGKALRREVRVVPVLVHGAKMPDADALPEDLRPLTRHQAIELSDARWDYDVTQLLDSLQRSFPDSTGQSGRKNWAAAAAIGLATILAGGWLGSLYLENTDPGPAVAPAGEAESAPVTRLIETGRETDRVQVPDLKGLTLDVARSRLREIGLDVGDITFLTLDRFKPGTVYCQRSNAGVQIFTGSRIGLCVSREKLPGIQQSGQIYLSDTQVFDLDGVDSPARGGHDIRFDASTPSAKMLQPQDGATMAAVGRGTTLTAERCAEATLSDTPIRAVVGTTLCLRTNAGRLARLRIDDVGEELKLSFDTWEDGQSNTGSVRLVNGESYHFKTGEAGRLTGGDLYVSIDENGGAQFYANNRGQQGVLDLGDIGRMEAAREIDLASLSGFYKFGVPLIEGHTYVSMANVEEPGHFILIDVDETTHRSVTLSYGYR